MSRNVRRRLDFGGVPTGPNPGHAIYELGESLMSASSSSVVHTPQRRKVRAVRSPGSARSGASRGSAYTGFSGGSGSTRSSSKRSKSSSKSKGKKRKTTSGMSKMALTKFVKEVVTQKIARRSNFRGMWSDTWSAAAASDGEAFTRLWVVNNSYATGSSTPPGSLLAAAAYTYGNLDDTAIFDPVAVSIRATAATTRFFRHSATMSHTVTNTSISDILVTEVRFRAKRDFPKDTLMANVRDGYTYADGGIVMPLVDGTAVVANASFTLPGDYGPEQNQRLRSFAKHIGTRTVRIAPGQAHTFSYSVSKAKRVDRDSLRDLGNNLYDLLRGCEFTVFGLCGTTATSGTGAAAARVGVGAASCAVVTRHSMNYSWVDDATANIGHQLAICGAASGGSYHYALPNVMNYNQNVIIPPDQATASAGAPTAYQMERFYAGPNPPGDAEAGAQMDINV